MASVSGEVFYRERIALPQGAELVVTLEDVSRMDVAATVVGEARKTLSGAPPYTFELPYPESAIDPTLRYSVRARILQGDQLVFTSTQNIDPFADAAQPLRIMLSAAGGKSTAPAESRKIESVDPLSTLDNTYWKLVAVGDRAVVMGESQDREAHMKLTAEDGRVQGYGSCNQFNGSYEVSGNELNFGAIAATRRACIDGMETEQGFFRLLGETAHYSIHRHTLTLWSAAKRPIGTFEAVYF